MSAVIEQESTELVTLPPKESALSVYSNVGGLDPLIEQIRAKVAGTVYNMATAKGRDECRSDAAKVARSKAAIEKLGKALSAEYKEIPKKIDAERKRAFDALEALQKEVRQPLTEWEEAEERRVLEHMEAIAAIHEMASSVTPGTTAETLCALLSAAEEVEIGPHWQEFEAQAARAKDAAVTGLRNALTARQKHEAEQAELTKLRAEAEERRQRDETERIAREAADRATQQAEAKAKAEKEAADKREADAKAALGKAEQAARDAVERQKQAEALAEAEKLAAVARANKAAEDARAAEKQRQKDEQARLDAEAKVREKDRAHKGDVMRQAKEAIMGAAITEDQARDVVKLILAGKVPYVSISF